MERAMLLERQGIDQEFLAANSALATNNPNHSMFWVDEDAEEDSGDEDNAPATLMKEGLIEEIDNQHDTLQLVVEDVLCGDDMLAEQFRGVAKLQDISNIAKTALERQKYEPNPLAVAKTVTNI